MQVCNLLSDKVALQMEEFQILRGGFLGINFIDLLTFDENLTAAVIATAKMR
jgi:hypothetical protein